MVSKLALENGPYSQKDMSCAKFLREITSTKSSKYHREFCKEVKNVGTCRWCRLDWTANRLTDPGVNFLEMRLEES
jgi:hypothetical protein